MILRFHDEYGELRSEITALRRRLEEARGIIEDVFSLENFGSFNATLWIAKARKWLGEK